ncbi:hypothetical protein F4809DRAFT_148976 [Biscogniauxia mediterranea]|nr:hypothetical protein F4809DRAFT_148976 [Biscogniauxia mediterranea]
MSNESREVLCGETWYWDSRDENQIIFSQDGTGKLICRAELNVWIAAEFDWKFLGIGTSGRGSVESWGGGKSESEVDGADSQFMLEMTLTKRRIPTLGMAQMDRYRINEEILTDETFAPKRYAVTLEAGEFITQFDTISRPEGDLLPGTPKFKFRLTFDSSPYPRREEWREPEGAPDAFKFWEWNQFCGGKLK